MKRSTLHQMIGALVCAGRNDLAKVIAAEPYYPFGRVAHMSNETWERKGRPDLIEDPSRRAKIAKRVETLKKRLSSARTPAAKKNYKEQLDAAQEHLKNM